VTLVDPTGLAPDPNWELDCSQSNTDYLLAVLISNQSDLLEDIGLRQILEDIPYSDEFIGHGIDWPEYDEIMAQIVELEDEMWNRAMWHYDVANALHGRTDDPCNPRLITEHMDAYYHWMERFKDLHERQKPVVGGTVCVVGTLGPKGGVRNTSDQRRLDLQREARRMRRETASRAAAGQKPSGQGFRAPGRESACRGPRGARPTREGGATQERNIQSPFLRKLHAQFEQRRRALTRHASLEVDAVTTDDRESLFVVYRCFNYPVIALNANADHRVTLSVLSNRRIDRGKQLLIVPDVVVVDVEAVVRTFEWTAQRATQSINFSAAVAEDIRSRWLLRQIRQEDR
jgi:hypothetical protein